MTVTLRPYQIEAVEALRNNNTGIVAAATGSGKTTMMASSILEKAAHGKVLVLVHLQQLVIQTAERIAAETGLSVGQYYEKRNDRYEDYDVLVATWQSLYKLTSTGSIPADAFYSINVDEAHHVSGKYLDTVTYFSSVFLHGYTATPYGPGEEILFDVFGDVIFSIDIFDLIELGYLSKLDMKVFKSKIKNLKPSLLTNYHKQKDGHIKVIENRIKNEERIPKLVHFFKGSKHINEYQDAVTRANAGVYTSKVSMRDRTSLLNNFNSENGDLSHLYSIRMLNEGVDIPIINGLVFHEHAGNFRTFTQRLGRGLRVYKNPEHKTYINQFLDYDDEESVASIATFQKEGERARAKRGNSQKYVDYINIELDQETEEFLDDYKQRIAEKEYNNRLASAHCAVCGKKFYSLKRTVDYLAEGDELICESCMPGENVRTKCADCGIPLTVKSSRYRLNVRYNTKFYCIEHSKTKHQNVTVSCQTCGKVFTIKHARYKAKKGQKEFYCSKECIKKAAMVKVACSVCGEEFEMLQGHYNKKIKLGGKFYCADHRRKRNPKPEVWKTLSCTICGKEETVKERTFDMHKKKQSAFLCEEHKYQRTGNHVRCYNCGEEMEITFQRYREYTRKGFNFHCIECRRILRR